MQKYARILQIQLNEKKSADWELSTHLRPSVANLDYHCNDDIMKLIGPAWAEGNAQ